MSDGKRASLNGTSFGERFEFEGQKYILVAELQDGFVLAVRAEDETPAPTYLLPSPRVARALQNQGPEAKETDPGVITIWTEGSCLGNPGPGGWAYVRQDGGGVLAVASGGEPDTTVARMEMQAVIEALKALPQRRFPIVLYSGSQPLVRTVVEGERWKRQTNPDLWEELDRVAGGLRLLWKWARGNKGEPEIERCRRLAEAAAIHQARVGVPPD